MILGVLGGGQLGRMLAMAAAPLGIRCRVLDPDPDGPAAAVAEWLQGDFGAVDVLDRFGSGLDAVTFEFENVPTAAIRRLDRTIPAHPSADALEPAQDRLLEKSLFRSVGIPTPQFVPIARPGDLEAALETTGFPAVLKTRRFGYDGKGQWVLRSSSDVERVLGEIPSDADALILEGFIRFDREVSQILVRGRDGDVAFYPLVENRHETGILRLSVAPAPGVAPGVEAMARDYARRIAEALDYVGVLTLELFLCGDRLLANEIAPRVHNSGHWTIEGAETSQFENHVRAVMGLPLGSTAPRGKSAMWNVLGSPPDRADVLSIPGAHLHLYGKEPRSGRKIGHITVCSMDGSALDERLSRACAAAPQS